MKKKKKKIQPKTHPNKMPDADLLRINKLSILFNNKELRAIEEYRRKYAIRNRSKLIRDIVLSTVIRKFEDDYPTLF
ncbi:MAG: hypothetical protein LBF89_10005 [Bacteroidales bacterium]|jgi:hypothetical protein|nr:hypothetical protein [Bacteroidales bacterium]